MSEESRKELREEIVELRGELAEVKALLRASLARRKPRRPELGERRVEAAPEIRSTVRDKMVRAAAKRARR